MSEKIASEDEQSFADMLDAHFAAADKLQPGQMLETRVLSVAKEWAFLELNGKSEGILSLEDVRGEDGEPTVRAGDEIRVFFVGAKNGEFHFTTRISADKAGPAMLEQAWRNKIPVEGHVEKEIKGGYEVKIGEARAFCPYSQMGSRRADSPADYVGKHLNFKIQEFKEGGRNILVSNRAIHEEAYQEALKGLKETIVPGAVVRGTIASIQAYGAFVDLGGVQGLVPVSEVARARVDDIHSVLEVGQEVEAVVLRADWQTERISLSLKDLQADPWDAVMENYPADTVVKGKVVRMATFGAFVNLEPGVDGLLHISEARAQGTYGTSTEMSVKMGQELQVRIAGVDVGARRISLKLAGGAGADEASGKYMDGVGSQESYNPFAALLKKK